MTLPSPRRHLLRCAAVLALASATASAALAAAAIGQAAPAFSAVDTSGRRVALADFRGRTVVLEWVNPGCPFVRRHYDAGNMQAVQKAALDKGVAWLAVNSTATDAADYLAPERLSAWMRQHKAAVTATLMDADGKVGRAYGARTTPHMYVIDARGVLVYAGAIDDRPAARGPEMAGATNHVRAALADVLAGRPVGTPSTQPYGCTVKYAAP
jgi:hypothetical protein